MFIVLSRKKKKKKKKKKKSTKFITLNYKMKGFPKYFFKFIVLSCTFFFFFFKLLF